MSAPANDLFANAATIAFGSSSAPTPSAEATLEPGEPDSYRNRSCWWRFTPSETVDVSVDTLQSIYPGTDPFRADTEIFVYTGSNISALTLVVEGDDNDRDDGTGRSPYGYLTEVEFQAVAGTTYYIRVASYTNALDMSYVLHLGPSRYVFSDWVQPPDSATVFAPTSGFTVTGALSSTNVTEWMSGYMGYKQLSRAFAGITPGTETAAIDCAWSHARRYQTSSFSWWSINNGPSWNGTDPYNPAIPGHGTCPALWPDPLSSDQTYTDHPIGYAYSSSSFSLGYQDMWFRTYALAQWVNLHAAAQMIGPSGTYGVPPYLAPWYPVLEDGEELIFESNAGTVSKCELQPTQPTNQSSSAGGTVAVDWTYSAACVNDPSDVGAAEFGSYGPTEWGPRWGDWIGHAAGPESFATQSVSDAYGGGVREHALATGWTGGTPGWTEIDAGVLEKAWAAEESDLPSSGVEGGIRCVGIPTLAKANAKPSEFAGNYGLEGQGAHFAYRHDAMCALRVTVRPPRYRIKTLAPPPPAAADVLIQAETLTQALSTSSAGGFARAAAGSPVTSQVLTVGADWLQRYDGAGIQLPEPGVSQGVLDQDGHERSLVGFDLSALPGDVDVVIVRLRVPWTSWRYFNGVGELCLGWHGHQQPPTDWSVGDGQIQRSTHEARQEVLSLALEWAAPAVESGIFGGLAIGPGYNDSANYAGSTKADLSEWSLEITYSSSEGG